jgi:uncharacterized protein (TIGR02722 family)
MKTIPLIALLSASALFWTGCTSPVRTVDPSDSTVQTMDISQADVNDAARNMVNSMLNSPAVARISGVPDIPTIVILPVRLDAATLTNANVNTDALTTLVRGQVINSGLFQFVDKTRRDDIADEIRYQQESGAVREDTAAQRGQQIGADYILEGTLSGFEDFNGKTHRVGYVLTLTLQDIESGLISWQETQQIAKEQKKGLFGW